MMIFDTFQDAFLGVNNQILDYYDYNTDSRIGETYEIIGLTYKVNDLTSFVFKNQDVGRLDYEYAETFYSWMISGGTDVKELTEKYPNVSKFMEKPKSELLPSNFNTFYGPRIAMQLPFIKKELLEKPNSRRAVISILDKDDLMLLDKDETLEFPCCDSATFVVRDNRLSVHVHMRSQNMGQVLKLDMYLWGKFTCELAKELGFEIGYFTSSVVSAHTFERDKEYITNLIDQYAI